ncbi:unnamed protein product [Caenorhabditis sp. 36 PRJEB53466]|nr:unnamed protein product [Caenorhabditis sp. 36 PRJEB53466]
MSNQLSNGYSVRDIILRYESEEEEFVRELEQMISHENESEIVPEPDEGPPILSVLCSLVDEIGSLRNENRRLKTRLVPPPRSSKNVVQRMSAMFEHRGSSFFPKLRRANRSSESMEIRNGARERLSTPPRKENNSMTTSTDVSYGRNSNGAPPIVRPELSDSEIDEQIFDEDDHRSRDTTRRCDSVNVRHQNDHSTSACTSPSSASSSRDPSETMMTSRSSFLDLLGLRRRSTHIPQPTYSKTTTKQVIKKRRRKCSGNDSESSGMYANMEEHCSRVTNKPPRPASYYRRDDSEDSDCLRQMRQRKAASSLNVNNYERPHEGMYRVSRETHWQHEKDNLMAEIEEMKMRNQRLVEQLREKSQQQSKLQCQLHKVEMQVNTLSRRCALSEALDRLTLDERMEKSATNWLKKIEERLRIFENQMQNAKLEAATAHQMALNSNCHEREAHQNCLEKLENLQREHMRVIHSSLLEIGVDEINMKRRLENLPTYEALYAFTHSVVRRLNEARWAMMEKTNEASRAQASIDLIVSQSSHLVSLAQLERLRLAMATRGKRQKRPSSFHGYGAFERNIRQDLNFYLPLKLHGSRVENSRRTIKKNTMTGNDRNIEEEFLKLFSYSKDFSMEMAAVAPERRATNRIETMIREMNGNGRPSVRRGPSGVSNCNLTRDRVTRELPRDRRPISLVETEERRIRKNEETRRSIKFMKTNSIDHGHLAYEPPPARTGIPTNVPSSQDVSSVHSPHNTPVFSRRIMIPVKGNAYDIVPEGTASAIPQMGRIRKLERAFSAESRNTVDSQHEREERRREHADGVERRQSKIQRSQPVSRLKQPSAQLSRFRTMENGGASREQPPPSMLRPRTLDPATSIPRMTSPDSRIPTPLTRIGNGEKRGWLERLKGIGKL